MKDSYERCTITKKILFSLRTKFPDVELNDSTKEDKEEDLLEDDATQNSRRSKRSKCDKKNDPDFNYQPEIKRTKNKENDSVTKNTVTSKVEYQKRSQVNLLKEINKRVLQVSNVILCCKYFNKIFNCRITDVKRLMV